MYMVHRICLSLKSPAANTMLPLCCINPKGRGAILIAVPSEVFGFPAHAMTDNCKSAKRPYVANASRRCCVRYCLIVLPIFAYDSCPGVTASGADQSAQSGAPNVGEVQRETFRQDAVMTAGPHYSPGLQLASSDRSNASSCSITRLIVPMQSTSTRRFARPMPIYAPCQPSGWAIMGSGCRRSGSVDAHHRGL
jgi:hypothetical protein